MASRNTVSKSEIAEFAVVGWDAFRNRLCRLTALYDGQDDYAGLIAVDQFKSNVVGLVESVFEPTAIT